MRNEFQKKSGTKKSVLKTVLLILAAALLAAFFLLPLPYSIESPGSTIDLKSIITVNDKKDESKGSFSLTSVSVSTKSTPVQLLLAKFDDFSDIMTEKELLGGATSEEYNQVQNYYMKASKNYAIEQAFKLAKVDYTWEYKGIYVMQISDDSNFKNELSLGDTITKADGQSFENNEGFRNYIKSKKVGDEVTITYIHKGKELTSKHKLIEIKDTETGKKVPAIGITLVDDNEIKSDTKVDISTGSIGGPSAGLMFTLEIYDQLTDGNLRQGKKVAGTGTMSDDGTVGRIGGIDKKVASASKNGVKIFFAPDDEISAETLKENPKAKSNYKEALAAAKKLKTDMKIVPVKTVQDAIDYLKSLDK